MTQENHKGENIKDVALNFAAIDADDGASNIVNFTGNYIAYGNDDDYPRRLNYFAKNSPLHGSLIKSISQMISGQDVKYTESGNGKVIYNKKGEDIHFIVSAAAEELKKNGYCYLEVKKTSKGAIVNVIPAMFVRNVTHTQDTLPKEFLVDPLHSYYSDEDEFSESRAIKVKAFDGKRSHSMMYIRTADTTTVSYAAPDYQGGIDDILLDITARQHKLNTVANGFFPSALVNFNNGVPTKEKRKSIENQFINKLTGSSGKTRIVFSWNEIGQDSATTLDTFEPPNVVKFFEKLTPELQQSILNSHRVTSPLLFGVRSSQGGLGSNKDEMVQAYDIFDETVISPFQKLLSRDWNRIIEFAEVGTDFEIIKMTPKALRTDNENKGGHPPVNIKDTKERVIDGERKGGAKEDKFSLIRDIYNLITRNK